MDLLVRYQAGGVVDGDIRHRLVSQCGRPPPCCLMRARGEEPDPSPSADEGTVSRMLPVEGAGVRSVLKGGFRNVIAGACV